SLSSQSVYDCLLVVLYIISPPHLSSPLFPYTTLSRSVQRGRQRHEPFPRPLAADLEILIAALDLEVGRPERHEFADADARVRQRSEEHTSELQSLTNIVCRLLLAKKKPLHKCKLIQHA